MSATKDARGLHEFDGADPDALIVARMGRAFPYATVGHWVLLADIPAQSCRLYALLRAHCNGARGDNTVWPTQKTLAEMMQLKRLGDVGKYTKPLVDLGAVEVSVQRWGPNRMYKRLLYTVHEGPPRGYKGPVSLAEWYESALDFTEAPT